MPPRVPPASASRAAYVASVLNLVAASAMVYLLQPGLPVQGSAIEGRIAWVASHHEAWWLGWITWHAAAISLMAFYVGLAGQWRYRAPILCMTALLITAAGLAADLGAEAILMGVLPGLPREAFATGEWTGSVLTGYLGNGLYSVGGALLTIAGTPELPRAHIFVAWLVWIDGICLSAATLLHSPAGMYWTTATLMPLFIVWSAMMGRRLAKR